MAQKTDKKEDPDFALPRENYRLLGIGFLIIVAGFLLMLGYSLGDSPASGLPGTITVRRAGRLR